MDNHNLFFIMHGRAAGSQKGKIGVVGTGTASVIKEVVQLECHPSVAFSPSKATGKVLASELLMNGNDNSRVLYPASAKAGKESGHGPILYCSHGPIHSFALERRQLQLLKGRGLQRRWLTSILEALEEEEKQQG